MTGIYTYREDGQKHIYFFPDTASAEILLYDFNLSVGDTLPNSFNQTYAFNRVYSIDSVLVGTQYHKRFNISETSQPNLVYVSLIEGIGSTFGLLETLVPVFEHSDHLMCFSQNGVPVFTDGTSSTCELPSAMAINESNSRQSIEVFPNPSSGTINVTSSIDGVIWLENILGKELSRFSLTAGTKTMDLSVFPKGIYILRTITDNGFYSVKKLILQ